MTSTTTTTLPLLTLFTKPSNPKNPVPKSLHFHPRSRKFPSWSIKVSNCIQIGPFGENLSLAHFDLGKRIVEDDMGLGNGVVVLRLRRLVSEFQRWEGAGLSPYISYRREADREACRIDGFFGVPLEHTGRRNSRFQESKSENPYPMYML
ncbi:hypothetical protein Droror1_Dr00010377 [Drosera rotundifolia]